jgi:hypothetical protein
VAAPRLTLVSRHLRRAAAAAPSLAAVGAAVPKPATGVVTFGTTVQDDAMTQQHGWISYTGSGDNSHLTEEHRQMVEERVRQRGQLLGVVQVRVFENGCEPFVTFPQGAVLGVETDQSVIAEMVARARTELVDWR